MALAIAILLERQARKIAESGVDPRASRYRFVIEQEMASRYGINDFNRLDGTLTHGGRMGSDPTVNTRGEFDYEGEFRSRDYTGSEILNVDQLGSFLGTQGICDDSSGLHIHFKASELVGRNLETPAGVQHLSRALVRLTSVCKRHELAVYALSGGNARRSSSYSSSWSSSACSTMRALENCDSLRQLASAHSRRRSFVNFHNLANTDYEPNERTIEFRCFSGAQADSGDDWTSPTGLHLTSAVYMAMALLKTAKAEMGKPVSQCRWESKCDTHLEAVKWFFHHSGKSAFVPYWQEYCRAYEMRHYLQVGAQRADDVCGLSV